MISKRKIIFFLVWLLILSTGPLTVVKRVPISGLSVNNTPLLISFLLRITALLAFSMLFVQIILGAFMSKWTEKFGGWVLKFHITQGSIVYGLILAHPLLFLFYNFKLTGVLDPFYVFTEICLLCRNNIELFYTLGRVSFWFITIAVLAAILRNESWWRTHWRKFHILNYFAFFLIAIHSFFVGTDGRTPPFVWFFWISIVSVIFSIFYKWIYLKIFKQAETSDDIL